MTHIASNWNARQRRAYIRQNGGYVKVLTGLDKTVAGEIAVFALIIGAGFALFAV